VSGVREEKQKTETSSTNKARLYHQHSWLVLKALSLQPRFKFHNVLVAQSPSGLNPPR